MESDQIAMPTISVIIPTYNRSSLLAETISCALSQTLPPQEIIVVDNSKDTTELDEGLFNNLRYIKTIQGAGASQARNIGATVASGDYLAFLDDDDLWEAEYLAKANHILEKKQYDLIIGRLDRLTTSGCTRWRVLTKETLDRQVLLRSNPGITGSNIIIRRNFFFALGGFNVLLRTGEDKGLLLDAMSMQADIHIEESMQAMHRMHSGVSLNTSGRHNGLDDFTSYYSQEMNMPFLLYNRLKAKHFEHLKFNNRPVYNFLFRATRKIRSFLFPEVPE